jgi:uncharacterized SAM-binding protein YcdF (DUF218 family)
VTEKERFIVLTSGERPQPADAVVLLEGDGFNRIATACDLIRDRYANILVFSGGTDNSSYGSFPYEKCVPHILNCGISLDQMIVEDNSQHTREQAEFAIDICQEHGWKSLILVASHYHQYRAFLAFLKVLHERSLSRLIKIYNIPAQLPWFENTDWGRRIDILNSEFQKINEYQAMNHLATFAEALEYYEWKEKN